MITVQFENEDWVWLCEFLSEVIKQGELNKYEIEDTERILDLLNSMVES